MRALACVLVMSLSCGGSEPPAPPAPPPAPAAATPAPAPAPAPEPSAAPATGAGVFVDVHRGDTPLAELLASEASVARQNGQRIYVELWAEWCEPCKALAAGLDDPRMQEAFQGIRLVRLDIDEWPAADLSAAGLFINAVPRFEELDASGRVTGRAVTGAAWGEDIPANIAPVLSAFFRGQPLPPAP